ncbi:hypothetical protein [Selenomonas ruminantium]|uniref:hypothetical protein n=1 Tax=Selenomonas ruminantium TaxID=971 RepID=UPI0026E9FB23|nr:hypothetical protein [Selenomonas ruminantium]
MAEDYSRLTKREQEIKLKQIQSAIAKTRREMYKVSSEMAREEKRIHVSKLINAGRVLEDAGVLEGYDENNLYLLLVMNKDYLLHTHDTTPSGKFDMMHGLANLT